jgi:hypothetical protein
MAKNAQKHEKSGFLKKEFLLSNFFRSLPVFGFRQKLGSFTSGRVTINHRKFGVNRCSGG